MITEFESEGIQLLHKFSILFDAVYLEPGEEFKTGV